MVRLIAELGSCHMGKLERIKEAIDRCKASGIDALKLQLFPNESPYVFTRTQDAHIAILTGNIYLPFSLFCEAQDYGREIGLPVSASVFDEENFRRLLVTRPDFIKLAYSKKDHMDWLRTSFVAGIETIVSCDVMTEDSIPVECIKLYCIPEYPVRYEVCFDELFPRFDGFSDHTLGIRQTKRAIEAGAKIIEKHVRLGYEDETCPDAKFAVTIEEFAKVRL